MVQQPDIDLLEGTAGRLPGRLVMYNVIRYNLTSDRLIRVNQQYRICFRWTEHGAEQVEIVDYHY